MSALASQQQALLDALFVWPPDDATKNIAFYTGNTWLRGLKVYQANGHALAERALQAAYPVLTQLLGQESLCALARSFWHAHPPVRGDLAQWGAELADFVRASEQLVGEPYLADVATVEWALHLSASAANQEADAASFVLLTQLDPSELQLRLAPGCAVVQSRWPVASIVAAHLNHRPDSDPGLREAGRRLRAGEAEAAVVWRAGLQSRVRAALAGEAAFVSALLDGLGLGDALDTAPALDFNAWLPLAVQTHLLLGAQALDPPLGHGRPNTKEPQP
nr:DNA-binding domain-containing protein [Rhodoferax sp.]